MVATLLPPIARWLARPGPETRLDVEFVAYTADCHVTGSVPLRESRLSDMLNRHSEIVLSDVVASDLAGGPPVALETLTLWRDELYAVHLAGPRGDREKRRATIPIALGMKLGPYLVRGHIHVAPGTDPINAFKRSRPMVALTDGWIEHRVPGRRARRVRVPAMVVNRLLVDWVTRAAEEEVDDGDRHADQNAGGAAQPAAGDVSANT